MEIVRANRLQLRWLFTFSYLSAACLVFPLSILFGIIGLTGGRGVYQNGVPVYGLRALFTAMLLGLALPLFPSALITIGAGILKIFGSRGPGLRIRTTERY